MKNCIECNSIYNENNVNIPNPIPDNVCSVCGTELTEEQINELINKYKELNESK
jgi:rRNA maturation endonuclease Nob1